MSVGQTCPALEKSADSFSLKNSASSGEKMELLAWFFDPIPTKPAKSLLQALFSFFFSSYGQNSSGCSCILWQIRIAVIPL
jgi:hypothetical protein